MPPILREVLGDRGWLEYDEDKAANEQPPFSLWWRTNRFTASQIGSAAYPKQRINHYPKSSEITKKDHLFRHLRRMRVVHGSCYDFSPVTFGLPNDYVKFCQFFAAEREKHENLVAEAKAKGIRDAALEHAPTYICKPSDMSRGRKIFVFREISDLTYDCNSVVQRYIERPLLIHGHKVDFRVYVLVTSFQPLRAYIYDDLLARFSVERYDLANVTNIFCHLTNYSVNKNSDVFEQYKRGIGVGCKWHGGEVRDYFRKMGVDWGVMWQRVEVLVCYTLLSIATQVTPVPQCFELYGFDIMFDEAFKPWLIEVNFSPALAVESDTDDRVKRHLMNDMIDTLNIPDPDDDTAADAGAVDAGDDVGASSMSRSKSLSPPPPAPASPPQPQPRGAAAASGAKGASAGRKASGSGAPLGPSGRPVRNGAAGAPPVGARSGARSGPRVGSGSSASSSGVGATRRTSSSVSSATASSSMRTGAPDAAVAATTTRYVDSPKGQFRWCFPFSPQTEQLAADLARKGAPTEQVLRACIGEVKRKEQRVVAAMADYADTYRARVAEESGGRGAAGDVAARRASASASGNHGDHQPPTVAPPKGAKPEPAPSKENGVQRLPADADDDEDVDLATVDLSAVEAMIAEARRMRVA